MSVERRWGCTAVLAAAFTAPTAWAERWTLEPSVRAQLTATSNSDLSVNGRSDTVLEVRPQLSLVGEGRRMRIAGTVAVDAIGYAERTQESRLLPQVDLTGRVEAIERLVFLDAGYRVAQTSSNVFGVRVEPGSTTNVVTTKTARISPSLEGGVPGGLRYSVRADNSWIDQNATATTASDSTGYFGRYTAYVAQVAQPLGWRLEADRSYTRYKDDAKPSVALVLARASISYALMDDLTAGLRAGRESENVTGPAQYHPTHGAELRWAPSARTLLAASTDTHFFGRGWDVEFNHRTPFVAWSLGLSRGVDTTPQSLFELPATQDVAGLLDAIFTTRFPDPAERARVVRDVINRNGLTTSTAAPISVLGERVSLVTRRRISIVFNGVNNTLSLGVYNVRTEDLDAGNALSTATPGGNNVQTGGSVALTHRVTPTAALSVALERTRIRALDGFGTAFTTQRSGRVQLNKQVAPRTGAFVGARHRIIESNNPAEGDENAVFLGLDHRF